MVIKFNSYEWIETQLFHTYCDIFTFPVNEIETNNDKCTLSICNAEIAIFSSRVDSVIRPPSSLKFSIVYLYTTPHVTVYAINGTTCILVYFAQQQKKRAFFVVDENVRLGQFIMRIVCVQLVAYALVEVFFVVVDHHHHHQMNLACVCMCVCPHLVQYDWVQSKIEFSFRSFYFHVVLVCHWISQHFSCSNQIDRLMPISYTYLSFQPIWFLMSAN